MHRFKDLVVWQQARELIKDIYQLTSAFPKSGLHELSSQIQRSAISIPSKLIEIQKMIYGLIQKLKEND